jgi:hypothetical protein
MSDIRRRARRTVRAEATMLSVTALMLLVVWAIALIGPFEIGQAVHVLLLVGLMLLLLAFMKARDAAMRLGVVESGRLVASAQRTQKKP